MLKAIIKHMILNNIAAIGIHIIFIQIKINKLLIFDRFSKMLIKKENAAFCGIKTAT